MSKALRSIVVLLCLGVIWGAFPPRSAEGSPSCSEALARAQELIDGDNAAGAIEILNPQVKKKPPNAEAFLMRSTALFMIGELEKGREDLDKAIKVDPGIRQAWLNRAALDLSEQKYPEALEALQKAKELDPSAPDNDLNIGAVQLLQGNLQEASANFRTYLENNLSSAEAFYLVATNYAMAGYAGPAMEHLRGAIDLNEKSRLRARTDPNFRDLEANTRFQQILSSDTYQIPPGSYQRLVSLEAPFDGSDGTLLRAVLDALQFSNQPFDRRVEVTLDWALIWGDMRIKLSNDDAGKGQILLTAPANQFTPTLWRQQTDALLVEITVRLSNRSR